MVDSETKSFKPLEELELESNDSNDLLLRIYESQLEIKKSLSNTQDGMVSHILK